jgi:hypothetical protein
MSRALIRERLFEAISAGLVLAACGGDSSSDQTSSPETGTGGLAGGGGIAGSGGIANGDAGQPSKKKCFTSDELLDFCGDPTTAACYASDTVPWQPDAGTACPIKMNGAGSVLDAGFACIELVNLEMQGDECCYDLMGVGGCGRPFLVDGEARRAATLVRKDWLKERETTNVELDSATREALTSAWLEDARLEHASVASFARFTLELLALGAPAELVQDAQRAGADEVEHARLCFTLASTYGGRTFGPGPLSMHGAFGATSLVEAAVHAAREGCVGETLAAIVAAEQLARATDPRVKRALERIARDEAAHAELAWRFVSWAIETGGETVRRAVVTTLERAILGERGRKPSGPLAIDRARFHAHGRLDPVEQREVELRALREVVEPCTQKLAA